MVLLHILFLIPLVTASRRFDGPSYRSNIMEGDKPILRMAPDADEAETDSDKDRQPSPPPQPKMPETGKDMKQLVNWLLDNFSYDLVALGPKKIAETDGNSEKILRNSVPNKSDDDVDTVIQKYEMITGSEPTTESAVEPPAVIKETSLRTNKKKHKGGKVVPEWLADLKEYIKDLTTRYGQHEVLEKTKPVIATLEKKHHMKIKDIDVDEYGEIHITYIEKGKGKKVARQSEEN